MAFNFQGNAVTETLFKVGNLASQVVQVIKINGDKVFDVVPDSHQEVGPFTPHDESAGGSSTATLINPAEGSESDFPEGREFGDYWHGGVSIDGNLMAVVMNNDDDAGDHRGHYVFIYERKPVDSNGFHNEWKFQVAIGANIRNYSSNADYSPGLTEPYGRAGTGTPMGYGSNFYGFAAVSGFDGYNQAHVQCHNGYVFVSDYGDSQVHVFKNYGTYASPSWRQHCNIGPAEDHGDDYTSNFHVHGGMLVMGSPMAGTCTPNIYGLMDRYSGGAYLMKAYGSPKCDPGGTVVAHQGHVDWTRSHDNTEVSYANTSGNTSGTEGITYRNLGIAPASLPGGGGPLTMAKVLYATSNSVNVVLYQHDGDTITAGPDMILAVKVGYPIDRSSIATVTDQQNIILSSPMSFAANDLVVIFDNSYNYSDWLRIGYPVAVHDGRLGDGRSVVVAGWEPSNSSSAGGGDKGDFEAIRGKCLLSWPDDGTGTGTWDAHDVLSSGVQLRDRVQFDCLDATEILGWTFGSSTDTTDYASDGLVPWWWRESFPGLSGYGNEILLTHCPASTGLTDSGDGKVVCGLWHMQSNGQWQWQQHIETGLDDSMASNYSAVLGSNAKQGSGIVGRKLIFGDYAVYNSGSTGLVTDSSAFVRNRTGTSPNYSHTDFGDISLRLNMTDDPNNSSNFAKAVHSDTSFCQCADYERYVMEHGDLASHWDWSVAGGNGYGTSGAYTIEEVYETRRNWGEAHWHASGIDEGRKMYWQHVGVTSGNYSDSGSNPYAGDGMIQLLEC